MQWDEHFPFLFAERVPEEVPIDPSEAVGQTGSADLRRRRHRRRRRRHHHIQSWSPQQPQVSHLHAYNHNVVDVGPPKPSASSGSMFDPRQPNSPHFCHRCMRRETLNDIPAGISTYRAPHLTYTMPSDPPSSVRPAHRPKHRGRSTTPTHHTSQMQHTAVQNERSQHAPSHTFVYSPSDQARVDLGHPRISSSSSSAPSSERDTLTTSEVRQLVELYSSLPIWVQTEIANYLKPLQLNLACDET